MDIILLLLKIMQDLDHYGIDWEGPVPTDGNEAVVIPDFTEELTSPQLTAALQEELESLGSDDKIVCYLVVRDITRTTVS